MDAFLVVLTTLAGFTRTNQRPQEPTPQKRRPARHPALETLPGHLIRRLQQVAVSLFLGEATKAGCDLTPVQYAALVTVDKHQGIDQATLAGAIAYDRATIVGVIDRLEKKGLVRRVLSPSDRRLRQLVIEGKGKDLLQRIQPAVLDAQVKILEPLDLGEQAAFRSLLIKLVAANNELSRAPMRPARRALVQRKLNKRV